ncbi:MAG: Conserved hypothetical membrane protein [uncultured Aureispira sp.]|uniref:Conserved hypothetical membrane protein n=1 Tax=uncultured Aureispira sp. TaxID=1331704 RepID=A0A6S6S7X1_9BACT|nr:MAG: Conserved hypothetical membrane protein [uncultured Aureispira sp.]
MDKNFTIAAILTFSFLSLGFLLLHNGLFGYGISFFVFLPFILGYLLGGSKTKKRSLLGFAFSFVIACFLLIEGGLEGMVCILMAMPLILISVGIGMLLKMIFSDLIGFVKKKEQDDSVLDDDILKSSILPFCILSMVGFAEQQLTKNANEVVEVRSEIILPYTPMQVYDAIKTVDTLDAEKPFLMQLDLPLPQKCILEAEEVGALRTCYFKGGGTITEQVTELEKGKVLRMDVLDYQLTGRTWLGFREAIYTFEALEDGTCKMARITSYTSELYPRVYWEPLERVGVQQEHEYVFRNLQKDLKREHN